MYILNTQNTANNLLGLLKFSLICCISIFKDEINYIVTISFFIFIIGQ